MSDFDNIFIQHEDIKNILPKGVNFDISPGGFIDFQTRDLVGFLDGYCRTFSIKDGRLYILDICDTCREHTGTWDSLSPESLVSIYDEKLQEKMKDSFIIEAYTYADDKKYGESNLYTILIEFLKFKFVGYRLKEKTG